VYANMNHSISSEIIDKGLFFQGAAIHNKI
jgi:hypothetical protein